MAWQGIWILLYVYNREPLKTFVLKTGRLKTVVGREFIWLRSPPKIGARHCGKKEEQPKSYQNSPSTKWWRLVATGLKRTQCLQVFLMPYNFEVLLYLDQHFSIAWHVSSEYQVLRDTSPFRIIKQQNSLHPLMGLPGERNSHQQRLKQSVAWEAWLGTLHRPMARKSSVGSTGPNMWGKSSGTIHEAPGEKKATT